MIETRKVGVLLDAYEAGADDEAVAAIAAALGVDRVDLSMWRMQARRSIENARADWRVLQEARAWRAARAAEASGTVCCLLSEMG